MIATGPITRAVQLFRSVGASGAVSVRRSPEAVESQAPPDVECRPNPRGDTIPDDKFATLWNQAHNLDEATELVREVAGKVPRWAVLAKASALRRKGVGLKRHELRGRAG